MFKLKKTDQEEPKLWSPEPKEVTFSCLKWKVPEKCHKELHQVHKVAVLWECNLQKKSKCFLLLTGKKIRISRYVKRIKNYNEKHLYSDQFIFFQHCFWKRTEMFWGKRK